MKEPPVKGKRSRRSPKRSRREQQILAKIHLNAAGIDVGSESHWVAVPEDRDEKPVREFRSFTPDLHALADWLEACGVETVAMESTGVYWIPLYEILEARGFEVLLVNARHVKRVPGRKSACSTASGSSSCTPSACCGGASDPMLRSRHCAAWCATATRSSRQPPPTCSACRRPSC
jgi:hypothetical protein